MNASAHSRPPSTASPAAPRTSPTAGPSPTPSSTATAAPGSTSTPSPADPGTARGPSRRPTACWSSAPAAASGSATSPAVESDTVRVQVVHQESGQELYLRDVVVYPWSIASFGRSTNPNRWARWLKHVARDGLARTLDIAVPGPHLATATDLDTGHQIASLVLDPELEAVR